jgi:hypothetical protein
MADIIFPGEDPVGVLGETRLPDNLDMKIWRGDEQTFNIVLQNSDETPLDLSFSTAEAVIKQSFNSATEYPFECTIHDGNELTLFLSSDVSETIPAGDYIWNFQITFSNGGVRTFLAGDVTVYAEVD